jgi:hypothetical protein
VYVDETNTLTTRPRLEKAYDLLTHIPEFIRVINVYPLTDKVLFQILISGETSDVVSFYIKENDIIYEIHTGDIVLTDKLYGVTEQRDNIYVVGDDYYVIKPDHTLYYVKDDAETYVPITEIRHADGSNTPSVSYESLNILSNKYRVEYYWDFNTDLTEEVGDGNIIANEYIKRMYSEDTNNSADWDDRFAYRTRVLSDSVAIRDINNKNISIFKVDNNKLVEEKPKNIGIFRISTDGISWLFHNNDLTGKSFYIHNGKNNTDKKITLSDDLVSTEITSSNFQISIGNMNEDDFVIMCKNTTDNKYTMLYYKYDAGIDAYTHTTLIAPFEVSYHTPPEFYINKNFSKIVMWAGEKVWIVTNLYEEESKRIIQEVNYPTILHSVLWGFDDSASKLLISKNNNVLIVGVIGDSKIDNIEYYTKHPIVKCVLSSDGTHVIYTTTSDNGNITSVRKYYFDSDKDIYLFNIDRESAIIPNINWSNYSITPSGGVFYNLIYYEGDNKHRMSLTRYENSLKPGVLVEYNNENITNLNFSKILRYRNEYWFCGNSNLVRWTAKNDATYLPEENYTYLGLPEPVIDGVVIESSGLILFKNNGFYLVTPTTISDIETYIFTEAKSRIGALSEHSAIISDYSQTPLYVGIEGVYGLQQLSDVQSSEHNSVLISEKIEKLLTKQIDKNKMFSVSRLYWTYFILPKETETIIYVLDDRSFSWYVWKVPYVLKNAWINSDTLMSISEDGVVYEFVGNDIISERRTEYYDEGKILIPWFWRSQILPLGTINYSKKLNSTTFIMTDTDESDEYGLNYKFKVFRKLATESNATTISNRLNYIQSVTKKTIIPRFNFLQFEISNVEEDYDNNKLRLVGLSLKYELLAGLM